MTVESRLDQLLDSTQRFLLYTIVQVVQNGPKRDTSVKRSHNYTKTHR